MTPDDLSDLVSTSCTLSVFLYVPAGLLLLLLLDNCLSLLLFLLLFHFYNTNISSVLTASDQTSKIFWIKLNKRKKMHQTLQCNQTEDTLCGWASTTTTTILCSTVCDNNEHFSYTDPAAEKLIQQLGKVT